MKDRVCEAMRFAIEHYENARIGQDGNYFFPPLEMLSLLNSMNMEAVQPDVLVAGIRAAFGLGERDKVKASRVLRDTLDAKLIKPVDPETAPRYMKYIPFWA